MVNNPLYVVVLALSVIAGTLVSKNQKVTVIIESNQADVENHGKSIKMITIILIGLSATLGLIQVMKHLFH